MRHHQHRGAQPSQVLQQGVAHRLAETLVKTRKGLVEQQQGGHAREGPCDGHPLLLPPGQAMRPGVREALDVKLLQQAVHPRISL